jgi:hypothetical protein
MESFHFSPLSLSAVCRRSTATPSRGVLCPAVPPDSMDKILRLYLGKVPASLPTQAPVTRNAKRSEATSRPCARFRAAFKRTHPSTAQHAGVLQIDVLCCRRTQVPVQVRGQGSPQGKGRPKGKQSQAQVRRGAGGLTQGPASSGHHTRHGIT